MNRIFTLYKNAFGGLSRPAWILVIVMLINRSGTMVLPFLSVYLTNSLHFTIQQAGIILSCFGLGSVAGAFLGGGLSDRYGHFPVQVISLIGGGIAFIILAGIKEYYSLIAGVIILSIIAESFRPANAASVSYYAKPENVARAFSLNRMAINLGFSIGPALGGLLASLSYRWLFMADGITCILAGIVFFLYFRNRKGRSPGKKPPKALAGFITAFRDKRFMIFIFLSTAFAVIFFQLFMTLPLYYREVYQLEEGKIGLLLAMNGIIVFTFEMIMVYIMNRRFRIHELIGAGMVLVGISFGMLNLYNATGLLVVSMGVLSIAEIFVLPFLATFVVQSSNEVNRGAYMGLYTFSFSLAHIIAPILGASIISGFGYSWLWWINFAAALLIGLAFFVVTRSKSGNTQTKKIEPKIVNRN